MFCFLKIALGISSLISLALATVSAYVASVTSLRALSVRNYSLI